MTTNFQPVQSTLTTSQSQQLKHSHHFNQGNPMAERKTRLAIIVTAIMMVAEISGGWFYNSMALLADGWHMSSHVLALGLSLFAYRMARKLANDSRFSFGTWKIEILGGYTSAILLVVVALFMFYESIVRLINPVVIQYEQAIVLALFGLAINLICAWLLHDNHHNDNAQVTHHTHSHHHHSSPVSTENHDLNLRAAYIHVLADAATSVFAILALFSGQLWGASWMDPVMGIVGALLVSVWAIGLLKDTGKVLLDAEMDSPILIEIKEVIEELEGNIDIVDLHLWRVGKDHYSCILSLLSDVELSPNQIKEALSVHDELVHISVELHQSRRT